MNIKYHPVKLEKLYTSERQLKREYSPEFSSNLVDFIGFAQDAESAYDIIVMPQYHMHLLHGNYDGIYSLSFDNKKSKWRLPMKLLNDFDDWIVPKDNEKATLLSTVRIQLERISNHYGD